MMFGPEFTRCVIGADMGCFKEGIALGFRNHSKAIDLLAIAGERARDESKQDKPKGEFHRCDFNLFDFQVCRPGASASQSQPARKAMPPKGVIAPSQRAFVSANT